MESNKKINGKKTEMTYEIEKVNLDNKEYFDSKTISNEFAKYFSTAGEKHAMQANKSNLSVEHYINKIHTNQTSAYFSPTPRTEIEKNH